MKDNVGLTILAAESKRTDGEVLNIGTGKPTTLVDLAELIIELCGKEGKLTPQFLLERPHEIKHRFPDISRMMMQDTGCKFGGESCIYLYMS